jgi:hypothetical protein
MFNAFRFLESFLPPLKCTLRLGGKWAKIKEEENKLHPYPHVFIKQV